MATERILVDSNYFIALFNDRDSLHSRALRISAILEETEQPMVITNLVFHEVVTVLSMRRSRTVAVEVGNTLTIHPLISITYIDAHLQHRAWSIFQEIRKKDTSFADCANIAAMAFEDMNRILTFDHEDFAPLQKQYRFKLYPTD